MPVAEIFRPLVRTLASQFIPPAVLRSVPMRHVLIVPNMVCQACVIRIEEAVHALDSAARVEADLSAQLVRVDTDETCDAVRRTLLDEGFPSQVRAG